VVAKNSILISDISLYSTYITHYQYRHSGGEENDGSDRGSDQEYDYEYEDENDVSQSSSQQGVIGASDEFVSEYFMKKKWAEKEAEIRAEKLKKKTFGFKPSKEDLLPGQLYGI
jgi:hypothetical protein